MHLVQKQMDGLPIEDTKTKSQMVKDIAAKLGVPVIDFKLAVEPDDRKEVTEYQLRARGSGRTVHVYMDREQALKQAGLRNLHCYKVTTISERI